MSRVTGPQNISNTKSWEELRKWTSILFDNFQGVVNGRLSFLDNMFVSAVDVTFLAANTDTPVTHTLKVIPVGYFIVRASGAVNVYDGVQAWDTDQIFLRADATETVKVLVYG